MKVLVVGASRGLGFEFVRQYRADGAHVTATARDEAGLVRLRELGADAFELDVTAGVGDLRGPRDGGPFDIAIFNAGVYGPRTNALEAPSQDDFDQVMHTNVLGAMRVLARLADALASGARVAVISSRMGSIGGRAHPNGWLYRASKAALNSVLKDASLAWQGRVTCVALHPGWVRTDLGGAGADLTPAHSVADMRRTLAALTTAQNGCFLNHDGTEIAW